MFDYTVAAIEKILEDVKRFGLIFGIVTLVASIASLIVNVCTSSGILWLNITLLCVTCVYLALFLLASFCKNENNLKWITVLKKIFKWTKLFVHLLPLLNTLYDIYAATTHVSAFSIIIVTFTAIFWILNAFISILEVLVEKYYKLVKEGITTDVENIAKPVKSVGNFFKRLFGGKVEETDEQEPSKEKKLLDKRVEKKREQKKAEKQTEKERKKQEKAAEKERKKQEKERKKAEKKGK